MAGEPAVPQGQVFWADPTAEPKRKYRWLLLLGDGLQIPQWICKKVSQPKFEISEHEHKYINHTFYYPGRITWEPVSVTLADPVHPDATKHMRNMLASSGYVLPTSPAITDSISKYRATQQTGKVALRLLGRAGDNPTDTTGNAIGEWTLKNPWIKSVEFSELDYESDELIDLTLSLRYDWAEYTSFV